MVEQKRLQPLNAFDVEVVGRLVEQKQIRLHEQKLGQLHAHLPTATEFAHLAGHVGHFEPQTLQDPVGLFLGACSPNGVQTFVGVAEFLDELGVAVAFVVGALSDFLGEAFEPRFKGLHFCKRLHGHFHDRGLLVVLHFLGQIANAVLFGGVHAPFRGLLKPRDDFEQRGLARSVSAHQTNAVFGANGQIHPLKQCSVPKVDPKRRQMQHHAQVRASRVREQKRAAPRAALFSCWFMEPISNAKCRAPS